MTTRDLYFAIMTVLMLLLAGCGQKTATTAPTAPPTASASARPADPPPAAQEQRPAELPGPAPRAVAASPSSTQPAPSAPGPPQSVDEFTEELI